MEQNYQISWYAPNFINMCIDNINDEELSGRIYHCYKMCIRDRTLTDFLELCQRVFNEMEVTAK